MKGELSPSGEDGILYALEAQNLNLEGTELIALSACVGFLPNARRKSASTCAGRVAVFFSRSAAMCSA